MSIASPTRESDEARAEREARAKLETLINAIIHELDTARKTVVRRQAIVDECRARLDGVTDELARAQAAFHLATAERSLEREVTRIGDIERALEQAVAERSEGRWAQWRRAREAERNAARVAELTADLARADAQVKQADTDLSVVLARLEQSPSDAEKAAWAARVPPLRMQLETVTVRRDELARLLAQTKGTRR